MREEAQARRRAHGRRQHGGAGIDVERGRVGRVRTTAGDVEAEHRRHRLRRVEPADRAHGRRDDPAHARDPPDDRHRAGAPLRRRRRARSSTRSSATWTRTCTSARTARGLEIGSYAHRPILHDPEEIPSIEEAALSPTEFPFTEDDFALQMEHALELMPEIVGDESVGIKYAINGLLSLTPDGLPLLGETPEVRGLWSAAAVWIKEGPGVGQGGRRVDDPRRAGDRPAGLGHRALLRLPEDAWRTSGRGPPRGSTRPTASSIPASSGLGPRRPAAAVPRARAGARRRLLRGGGVGAPALVRVQRGAARGVRASTAARRSGTRAGGRRSSTPSTSRCATARRCST